jgi:eukaryotic-like serine/threonine-protein kinase
MSTDFIANSQHGVGPVVLPTANLRFGCWRVVSKRGQGRWHTVYLVQPFGANKAPRNDYSLKAVTRGLSDERHWQAIDRLARRVMMHELWQHSGVAPILDAELDQFPFFIVEPLIPGQSLLQLAKSICDWHLSKTLWIARQVAEILNGAHHKAITHLGLKPDKIVVDANGKVTVHGWSNTHRFDQRCWLPKESVGDVFTRAPEAFFKDYRAQPAADVFSFGTLLFFLFSGTWPTCGRTVEEVERQQKSLLPPDLLKVSRVCPEPLAALINRMLAKNPLRRPAIDSVLDQLVSIEIDQLGEQQCRAT